MSVRSKHAPVCVAVSVLLATLPFVSACGKKDARVVDRAPVDRVVLQVNQPCTPADDEKQGGAAIAGDLQSQISAIVQRHQGDYSVYAQSVDGSWSIDVNGHNQQRSASIIKVPILGALLASGTDLNEQVHISSDECVGGTGHIEANGGGTYSYSELAHLMINASDNTATNKIIDKIGMDAVNSFASSNGCEQTILQRLMMHSGNENYTCAYDITMLLVKIWKGEFVDASSSEFAKKCLEEQEDDKGILQGLPSGITFAHKTGTLDSLFNDAGIVESGTPYAVTVLCDGADESDIVACMTEIAQVLGDGSAGGSTAGSGTAASGGSSGSSSGSNSGSSSSPSGGAKSMVNGTNMYKEKDGYKIPGDYLKDKSYHGPGTNFSPGDAERGKGLFTSENCGEGDSGYDGFPEDNWSHTHYEVNARWEYASWDVVPGMFPAWEERGTSDGLGNIGSAFLDNEQYQWTVKQRVLVYNPENGKGVVCECGDGIGNPNWGPGTIAAVGGLSYLAQEALGFNVEGMDGGDYDGSCLDEGTEMEMWWVDENTPLGPTQVDSIAQQKKEECKNTGKKAPGVGVEAALQWAETVASNPSVGYCWGGRDSVRDFDGTTLLNCDCSALVYWSLVVGGGFTDLTEVSGGESFYTGNQKSQLESIGFTAIPFDAAIVQRGDILLDESSHTAWASGSTTGDGMMLTEASMSETGNVWVGAPGDQLQMSGNGEEVYYQRYRFRNFDYIMRYSK